ncbi:hypothetical protein GM3709_3201 [Geminocystis sp. NIES-3709]|nr:hypothetical protein GM3709_3201 [Geminocystis sp. NIES-3709]
MGTVVNAQETLTTNFSQLTPKSQFFAQGGEGGESGETIENTKPNDGGEGGEGGETIENTKPNDGGEGGEGGETIENTKPSDGGEGGEGGETIENTKPSDGGEGGEGGETIENTKPSDGGEGGESGEKYSEGEQANADFKDKVTRIELLNNLRQGGYIIYLRHAQTEKDYADQINAVMGDCSSQRMLSEVGWNQSKMIGQAFSKYQIPVGEVISSQYCRAWQTADLAFGKYVKNSALNFPKAEDYTDEQVAQMKAQLMPLLTKTPPQGTNTIIVGHDDLFEAATGIYPAPQGMAYVVKPDGKGGFELVANMLPEEWDKLSQN